MMTKTCLHCGEPFPTARSHAKWCSERCRKRAAAGLPPAPPATGERVPGPVHARVVAELAELGALDTVDGRTALVLALYVDDTATSAAGAVSCSRELVAALGRLRQRAEVEQRPSIFTGLRVARGSQ